MRSRSWAIAVVITALVAAGVLAVDTIAPPAVPTETTPVETSAAVPAAGASVCAVGTTAEGAATQIVTAAADTTRAQPASVTASVLEDGTSTPGPQAPLFPGGAVRTTPELGDLGAVDVRWRDAPVAVSREWVLDGAEEVPDVTIAGPCASTTSDRWVVPGLSTSGGDEARLRLANPFRAAATVAVTFLAPEGAESPLILRNVSIPGRSVREITVNDTLPERTDLAAIVQVASGRLVVEGYQLSRSAIGGVDGGSLLAAAPRAAEEWTIPWLRDDAATSSWLWLANPGDRTAGVELTLHTEGGGQVPDGLAEVSVAPGELQRVDLTGTFPEDIEVVGLTARSNGAPIVVSGGSTITSDDVARTATVVQLGAPAPDPVWTLSGTAAGGRDEALRLVNPTGEPAVVDVELQVGVSSVTPPELQGLEIGPGAAVELPLSPSLGDAATWTAHVRASSGAIVAGRVGSATQTEEAEGPLRFIATIGTPSAAWRTTGSGLVAVQQDGLVAQLRTSTGIRVRDPLEEFELDGPGSPAPGDEPELPDDPGAPVDPDDPAGPGDPDEPDGGEAPDGGGEGEVDDPVDPAEGDADDEDAGEDDAGEDDAGEDAGDDAGDDTGDGDDPDDG